MSVIWLRARILVSTAVLAIVTITPWAHAENRRLTLDAIFSPDPEVRVDFGGTPIGRLGWTPDSQVVLRYPAAPVTFETPQRIGVGDSQSTPLFDVTRVVTALANQVGIPGQESKRFDDSQWSLSPDGSILLLHYAGDLYEYELAGGTARRLTDDPFEEEVVSFSPDSRHLSFVRQGDLYRFDRVLGVEIPVSVTANREILNGKLDWVYQEELYGRGEFSGHWWSPDSTALAFLQLDESAVEQVTLIDFLPIQQEQEIQRYPGAGGPNPVARLGVASVSGDPMVWIDTSRYTGIETLIVRVGWTPDSRRIVFLVQDREQTWLDINTADPKTGAITTLLHETSPAFIDVELAGMPVFLPDGSFLWRSGRNGYHHLYHLRSDGEVVRQLTNGRWEVRELYGLDPTGNWIYFSATEHSPIETHLYRIRLDGSGLRRLSQRAGSHSALFSPDFSRYLDTWSDYDTPPQVSLHRADGSLERLIVRNDTELLSGYDLAAAEFVQVPTPDGFLLEGAILRPPDFDPNLRYPVLYYGYGGPHSQTVQDRWGGSRHLWLRLLAQEGFVVWMCDNRSASGKGIWPTWRAHRRLGETELEDIETCIRWLEEKTWVDPDRTGIYGGSYGGYLATYALTHSDVFEVGIAWAPVTDWRLYDSIYTERYMARPENNPEGYTSSSVLEAADRLRGRLLLIHGTMDDNVHMQNTLKLADALQRSGKQFELMLYPSARHGIKDPAQILHHYSLMTRFLLENL